MKKSRIQILSFFLVFSFMQAEFLRDDIKEVVFDTSSNLMWQDNSDVSDFNKVKNWNDSINYCKSLDFAGFSDWHLPNAKELYSLLDRSRYRPAINEAFTYSTVYDSYYSSSSYIGTSSLAYRINFSLWGISGWVDKSDLNCVRCVRLSEK